MTTYKLAHLVMSLRYTGRARPADTRTPHQKVTHTTMGLKAHGRPLQFYVPPELKARITEEADQHYEGNMARALREMARTHVRLRDALGDRFELVIARLVHEGADGGRA